MKRPSPAKLIGRRTEEEQHAAATIGPLEDLAAEARYHVDELGTLPLLRYVAAVR